ncbi:MAG: SPFH domain-containing protein [Bacteroidia bacterium]|nr:SPFH domain-containing protein [Bacteroidia bacterium]
MGIFDFIKGQLIDVIEWVDESRDTIVWKYPDQDREIKMGAQLTVRESQVAIFINEGKLADVFEPGRYELTTRNMPILTTLKSWKHGFNSPFKVDIYFVNTKVFTDQKWGTKQPILMRDPDFESVRVRAFGSFSFRVSDAAKFFRNFAGTDPHVTSDEILEQFRTAVVSKFTSAVAKSGKSILDLASHYTELGDQLLPSLKPDFEEFGTTLTKFYIENISLPEEVQKEIDRQNMEMRKKRKSMQIDNEMEFQKMANRVNLSQNVDDMNKFVQFQAGISMEKEGGSETGNMMKNAMEMGLGMNMMQQMMNNMQQMQNPQNQKSNQTPPQKETKEQIMATLKELADLKTAGILTEEEFNEKKKDLLSRL